MFCETLNSNVSVCLHNTKVSEGFSASKRGIKRLDRHLSATVQTCLKRGLCVAFFHTNFTLFEYNATIKQIMDDDRVFLGNMLALVTHVRL